MSEEIVFVVAAAIALTGALGVVLSRNPVHAALFLVQTLVGVAVHFVLADAHFLAAVQVIVYAGAIVILFLFVIMLLGVDRAESLGVEPLAGQRPVAVVIGAGLVAALLTAGLVATDALTGAPGLLRRVSGDETDIETLAAALFTRHVLAFELTAALLTVAVLGAVALTRRRVEPLPDPEPDSFDVPPAAPPGADADEDAEPDPAGEVNA